MENTYNFIDFYTKYINNLDIKILLFKNYGKQLLSFKIKNNMEGNFFLINISTDNFLNLKKIEDNLKLNENVIRILITKIKKINLKKILTFNNIIKFNSITNLISEKQ